MWRDAFASGLLSDIHLSFVIRRSSNAEATLRETHAIISRLSLRTHGLSYFFDRPFGHNLLSLLRGQSVLVLMARKCRMAIFRKKCLLRLVFVEVFLWALIEWWQGVGLRLNRTTFAISEVPSILLFESSVTWSGSWDLPTKSSTCCHWPCFYGHTCGHNSGIFIKVWLYI